jgi:hypothetical protein
LNIDVKTVRRVKKGVHKRQPRPSKLDAFKPVIQELVVKKISPPPVSYGRSAPWATRAVTVC